MIFKQPNLGDIKVVSKFAFFPVSVFTSEYGQCIVWFQRYYQLLEFTETRMFNHEWRTRKTSLTPITIPPKLKVIE